MKIAIIGTGFAGLSVGYYLAESRLCNVTFFEAKKIGGGASGIATGLINPYPGQEGRRSWRSDLAIADTKGLLAIAQPFSSTALYQNGILRYTWTESQKVRFFQYAKEFKDVIPIQENIFMIVSGLTVRVNEYLDSLWKACADQGALLVNQTIKNLNELEDFDAVVIAAGWGIKELISVDKWNVQFVKGHSVSCHPTSFSQFNQSCVAEGYLAMGDVFEIGSTYEHEFTTGDPCMATAKTLLKEKIQFFCPGAEIISCKAGIRVARICNYFPIVEQIDKGLYLYTSLGSRGLLYHAYFGKLLAQTILCNEG